LTICNLAIEIIEKQNVYGIFLFYIIYKNIMGKAKPRKEPIFPEFWSGMVGGLFLVILGCFWFFGVFVFFGLTKNNFGW